MSADLNGALLKPYSLFSVAPPSALLNLAISAAEKARSLRIAMPGAMRSIGSEEQDLPAWWSWELELTLHVLKRMED
jgi:hypothetical protein